MMFNTDTEILSKELNTQKKWQKENNTGQAKFREKSSPKLQEYKII